MAATYDHRTWAPTQRALPPASTGQLPNIVSPLAGQHVPHRRCVPANGYPGLCGRLPELYTYLASSIDLNGRPFMPPRPYDTFSGVAPESVPAELLGMKYIADPQVAASLGSQYLIVGVSSDLVLWSGPIDMTFSPQTYAPDMSVLVSVSPVSGVGLMYPSSVVLIGPFTVPALSGVVAG
jgi:hypothetical protein